jgi:hypothetical protein
MRDRPHAEIPDSTDDTHRDSDAPTQLWSGRLSISAPTPHLRAARRRQRLEALLNTQTGITFEATPEASEANVTEAKPLERVALHPSTTPPVVAAARPPMWLSGPQLALFVAVGVAVGGMAALHVDHLLHPFGRNHRETATTSTPTHQTPMFAANAESQRPTEESKRSDVANVHVAAAPVQPARTLPPRVRTQMAESSPQAQTNAGAADRPAAVESPSNAPTDLRIPTQLHPRINPLMTSNQVFRDD